MHELSLAQGILKVVEDALRHEGPVRVSRLVVEVGALAGVETRSLEFALQGLAPGTVLQGATIELDEVPGQAWCLRCSTSIEIRSRLDPCPHCGGVQIQPTGGTELKVRDLRVQDLAPATVPRSNEE